MAKVVHEIVSNVDTIIVLKNPSIHFASWEDLDAIAMKEAAERIEEDRRLAAPVSKKKKKKGRKASLREEEPLPPPPENLHEVERAASLNGRVDADPDGLPHKKEEKAAFEIAKDGILQSVDGEPRATGLSVGEGSNTAGHSIFGGGHLHANSNITEISGIPEASILNAYPSHGVENKIASQLGLELTDEATADPVPSEEEGIHFHVCSGNLMSASPWFNRVLKKDGWMESNRNDKDRRFRISAEDWDEGAFLILMNIFHLRNRDVPRTVSLEMLAKIAILVDYYNCGEAIELFSAMWIADLRGQVPIPTIYDRTLVLWIWISWVFKRVDLFKQSTCIAIEQCTESMQTLGLPIPSWITEHIDLKRYQAIEGVISGLHELLDTYRSATYQCIQGPDYSFECGSMLLGALTKRMTTDDVFSPRPEIPFARKSLYRMRSLTNAITSPVWYHSVQQNDYRYNRYNNHNIELHSCSIETAIRSIVDAVTLNAEGLSLLL